MPDVKVLNTVQCPDLSLIFFDVSLFSLFSLFALFSSQMDRSHAIPFRDTRTVQPDFLHHHIIRQTDVTDYGSSYGWNAEMHLYESLDECCLVLLADVLFFDLSSPLCSFWAFSTLHHDVLGRIMLDGSNPPAFAALTEEWTRKSPLFFTINDLGWTQCRVGNKLHEFFQSIFPTPSSFEVEGATKYLSLGYCT